MEDSEDFICLLHNLYTCSHIFSDLDRERKFVITQKQGEIENMGQTTGICGLILQKEICVYIYIK